NVSNIMLTEIIDEEATNRNLCTDVNKNPNCAEYQMPIFPEARLRRFVASTSLRLWNRRQFECGNRRRERNCNKTEHQVWQFDRGRLVQSISLQHLGWHLANLIHALGCGAQNKQTTEIGCDRGS